MRSLDTRQIYYVYVLLEKNTPVYVGKGKGIRWEKHNHEGAKIKAAVGMAEGTALLLERELIEAYGRADRGLGPLRNRTDGGQGVSGLTFSEAQRMKMRKPKKEGFREMRRQMQTGRIPSTETRERLSAAQKARGMDEGRIRQAEKLRGVPRPAGMMEALRLHSVGRVVSDETKQKLRDKSRGKTPSLETRQKLSEALKGRKKPEGFGKGKRLSDEHKRKMSVAAVMREQVKREKREGL